MKFIVGRRYKRSTWALTSWNKGGVLLEVLEGASIVTLQHPESHTPCPTEIIVNGKPLYECDENGNPIAELPSIKDLLPKSISTHSVFKQGNLIPQGAWWLGFPTKVEVHEDTPSHELLHGSVRPSKIMVKYPVEKEIVLDLNPMNPYKDDANELGWDWNTMGFHKGPCGIRKPRRAIKDWSLSHQDLGPDINFSPNPIELMRRAEKVFHLSDHPLCDVPRGR
jgi:hypothetical protein